jgi:hypothetical protein
MASLTDSKLIARARLRAEEILQKDFELNNYEKLLEKIKELSEVFVQD